MAKRLISTILSVLLLLSCVGFTAMAEDNVATFGLFSDVHNVSSGFANVLNNIYSLSNDGKDLDGVGLIGDIVYLNENDIPSATTYQMINANTKFAELKAAGKVAFAMGNHEFPLYAKDAETCNASRTVFTEETGLTPENDVVMGGYHFITAGPATYGGELSAEQEAYATERITEALSDGTTKPVFLLLHHPVDGTLYGTASNTRYSDEFEEFVKSQPRLIVVSGHTHYPESDPKSIYQVPGGATFVYTSRVSGGNGADSPYSTERHNEAPSQALMVNVDKNTNVVTLKRFYVDSAEPSYLGQSDWTLDIPAMMAESEKETVDTENVYKYTDARAEKSVAPSFAEGASITTSDITDTSVTVTFPTALAGSEGEDSIVAYYKIDIYNKELAANEKTVKIMSDFFLKTQREAITQTVFGLQEGTAYEVSITPVSAWFKEGTSIKTDFTTTAPEFVDVTLQEDYTYSQTIQEAYSLEGTYTDYTSMIHIYKTVSNCKVKFLVNIDNPGMYRLFTKVSAEGAVSTQVTIAKASVETVTDEEGGETTSITSETTLKTIDKTVNTGGIHTFKEVPYVDYAFAESGYYTISFRKSAAGDYTMGFGGIKLGRYRDFTVDEIGYTLKKNAGENTATNVTSKYGDTGYGMASSHYITWEVTPQYSGVYDLAFRFGCTNGTGHGYVNGVEIGSATATGTSWNSDMADRTVGEVALLAGETYTVQFKSQSGNPSIYFSYMTLTWKEYINPSEHDFTFRYNYTKTALTDEEGNATGEYDYNYNYYSGGTAYSGSYIMSGASCTLKKEITVPLSATYRLSIKGGNEKEVTTLIAVSGLKAEKVTFASTGSTTSQLDNRYCFDVPLREGVKYVVTIQGATQSLMITDLILTTVGEFEELENNVIIPGDYTKKSSTNNSHVSPSLSGILLVTNNYTEYEVYPGAGNYKVYVTYKLYAEKENATYTRIAVDGTTQFTTEIPYNSAKQEACIGTITLGEKPITLRVTNPGGLSATYFYLYEVRLEAIDSPVITMYSGSDKTNVLTEGTMKAGALLPKAYDGKNVTIVFALYEDNSLYKVAFNDVKATKNGQIDVTMEDITFEEGKTYKSKVMFVNSIQNLLPYCAVQSEGVLTN